MNVIDIIILLIISIGALIGFKNGVIKQSVSFIGFLIVLFLSFLLKNIVSHFFYMYLPFFGFSGIIKGVTVLNIAVYEIIAFVLVLLILMILFRVLLKISGVVETILKLTVILSFPSKILGAIVGMIESLCFLFILLYILSLPIFNVTVLDESNLKDQILNETPVLSESLKDNLIVFEEFSNLKEKYKTENNSDKFNLEALDLFLKYKVVTVESIDSLKEKGKINIPGMDSVLNKYREVD